MSDLPTITAALRFCIVNGYPKASRENFDRSNVGHPHDLFKPDQSAPSLTTAPAETESVADSALATQADVAAVTGGELVAGSPVIESRPPDLAASAPAESIPPTGAAPAELGSLPEVAMVDPGAPKLEEASDRPAGANRQKPRGIDPDPCEATSDPRPLQDRRHA